jgi:signal transduction histidine kinase
VNGEEHHHDELLGRRQSDATGAVLTSIQVTLASLSGKLDTLSEQVAGRLNVQEVRMDALQAQLGGKAATADLREAESRCGADRAALRQRVDELESWQTWAVRLLLGAVLTAAMAALLSGGV